MTSHRFVLSAGHRNENRGGAIKEIDWTYPMTKRLQAAIQRRGGRAWVIQEEDGDGDPTFCRGHGLQSACRHCTSLASVVGAFDAYISCHYEGSPARGFFGIHPDATNDTKAMNPLDVALIEKMAKHVSEKTGMPARKLGRHPVAGVMSEKETGVGAQGYRLGEFVGTLPIRETTARVIIEAGSYSVPADRAMLWDWAWVDRYCEALVDALEEQFGMFSGEIIEPPPLDPPEVPDTMKLITDLPVRQAPGFAPPILTWLERGTACSIIAGPTTVDGIGWYDIRVEGFGTGFVPATILNTVQKG